MENEVISVKEYNIYPGLHFVQCDNNILELGLLLDFQRPGTEIEEFNIAKIISLKFVTTDSIDNLINHLSKIKQNIKKESRP